MTGSVAYRDAVDAYLVPRIVRLGPNLYGAAFFLMKLIPATFILRRAAAEGRLPPGTSVVETTSGTFGLALAIVCNNNDWRLTIVSDPVIDGQLRRRLEDLGTTVEITPHPAPVGGYQRSRLDRLAELLAADPTAFCPSQYDNPQNPQSYALLAEHLVTALGRIDCLVGPVGSGGSMCGTSAGLRVLFPELTAIGVDTTGSVLFGQPDGKRLVRGLGNSLMPANLDHRTFDEVHWLDAATAYGSTRLLHQRHSLFMGGTSGAAYAVGQWYARHHPDRTTVVLLPDEGYRYLDTVYDDSWLDANGIRTEHPVDEPVTVADPRDAAGPWSRFGWGRRSYVDVLGAPFVEAVEP